MGLRSRPIFRNRHFTFVFPPRNMTGMNHLAYQMHVQPGSATAYITNGMLLSSRALYLHAKRCFGTIHHTGDAQKSSLRSENQWFGDRGVQGLFWYTSCDGYLGLKGTIGTWVCLEIQKQLLSESFNCQTRRPIPILLGTPKSYILASISTPMISHYITMCVRLVRFVPIYATFFRPRQTYYQSWKPGQKVARFHARTSWGVRRWWFARARLGYRRVHGVIPGLRAHIGRTGSMGFFQWWYTVNYIIQVFPTFSNAHSTVTTVIGTPRVEWKTPRHQKSSTASAETKVLGVPAEP